MKYSDLVITQSDYTYSVNIQFDINNENKIAQFIPNETTMELLRLFFTDIIQEKPKNHARILYGSYGTGKSHFLTVLNALLGHINISGVAYNVLLNRINDFDTDLVIDIENFIKNRKPFLIVPISFDFEDFDRCIFFSLRKVLDEKNINVNLKSFYTNALDIINQWVDNVESFEKLKQVCVQNDITFNLLVKGLRSLDHGSEQLFKKIFSEVTFGVKFVQEVTNLIDNLNEVNAAIADNYSGIIFVFDEFGRYLEDNIRNIKIKAVQDIAEYCDHSKYNNQIILISHKEVRQYTLKYDKALINEWKKVEGRYKSISINSKFDQCLSLIKYIIPKNEANWKAFKIRFQEKLTKLYNSAGDFKGFLAVNSKTDNPFDGGYPIHPIALFALDRMSKKVAQNERTFFTFLAGNERHSLYDFLRNNDLSEFHFLGIDQIYDYFEENIKSIRSSEEYEVYRKLHSALNKCNSSLENYNCCLKILKTIASIEIIGDYGVISATKSILLSTVDEDEKIKCESLKWLEDNKIIKFFRNYGYYSFFDASIFDIDKEIKLHIDEITTEAVVKILNEEFINFILYPYEYNEAYKVKRMFLPLFLTVKELEKSASYKRLPEHYDGVLAFVLDDKDIDLKNLSKLSRSLERIIIITDKNASILINEVKRYNAIRYLETRIDDLAIIDPTVRVEIQYYIEEQISIIESLVFEWRSLNNENIHVFCEGEEHRIQSNEAFQCLANDLMFKYFSKTLIVNNEMLNKNNLTGVMAGFRREIVNRLMTLDTNEGYLGFQIFAPEYTSLRSVLAKNGLYEYDYPERLNTLPDGTNPSSDIINIINSFMTDCRNAEVSFAELYLKLKKPPFGLRDGYLPILLASVLRKYQKSIIIKSHGADQEISGETFEEMLRRPDDYSISINEWGEEKENYIRTLELLYSEFINVHTQKRNRLKALYEGMLSHYKNISKLSRTSVLFISDRVRDYRKLIEKDVYDYVGFYFEDFVKIGGSFATTAESAKTIKEELESLPQKFKGYLYKDFFEIFNIQENKDLRHLYENNWKYKKKRSFDYYTNTFLDTMSKLSDTNDVRIIISLLARSFTGFEIEYWNDDHRTEFRHYLIEVKNKLDNYDPGEVLSEKEMKMIIESPDGTKRSIIFELGASSPLILTAKNRIETVLDQCGQSVTYGDKIQVILRILDELLENKQ